jgi:hypothetical protein
MITLKIVCASCKTYQGVTMHSNGFMQFGKVELPPCPMCNFREHVLLITEGPDQPNVAGTEIHSDHVGKMLDGL